MQTTQTRQSASTDRNSLKFARAKTVALARFMRLFLLTGGISILALSAILTLISCFVFHLNAPIAFAGSLIGSTIILLKALPLKKLWTAGLVGACQEEGLWEMADQLAIDEAGTLLQDILAGRHPRTETEHSALMLSQIQVIMIRKGQLRNAMKVAEYLQKTCELSTAEYQANTLAAIYIEIGKFQEGIALQRNTLAALEVQERIDSPPYVGGQMALVEGFTTLHRIDEAQTALKKSIESIELVYKGDCSNTQDNLVKIDSGRKDIDLALYWLVSGRLKTLMQDPDAESDFEKALKIMKNDEYQRRMTLLYPEILLGIAFNAVAEKQFAKAEKYSKDALDHYETKTRFTGRTYVAAKSTLAYSRLKQGSTTSVTADLQNTLHLFQAELEKGHPQIATNLVQLAESYIADGDTARARESLDEALKIRTALFSETDSEIREIHEISATIK